MSALSSGSLHQAGEDAVGVEPICRSSSERYFAEDHQKPERLFRVIIRGRDAGTAEEGKEKCLVGSDKRTPEGLGGCETPRLVAERVQFCHSAFFDFGRLLPVRRDVVSRVDLLPTRRFRVILRCHVRHFQQYSILPLLARARFPGRGSRAIGRASAIRTSLDRARDVTDPPGPVVTVLSRTKTPTLGRESALGVCLGSLRTDSILPSRVREHLHRGEHTRGLSPLQGKGEAPP